MKRPPAWIALIGGLILLAIAFFIGYRAQHSVTAPASASAHAAAH